LSLLLPLVLLLAFLLCLFLLPSGSVLLFSVLAGFPFSSFLFPSDLLGSVVLLVGLLVLVSLSLFFLPLFPLFGLFPLSVFLQKPEKSG
jgi:hypothetical protein